MKSKQQSTESTTDRPSETIKELQKICSTLKPTHRTKTNLPVSENLYLLLFSLLLYSFSTAISSVRGKSCGSLLGIQDANSGTAIAEPLDLTRWKEWQRERRGSLGIQNAKVEFKKRTVNVKECQRTLCQKVMSRTRTL